MDEMNVTTTNEVTTDDYELNELIQMELGDCPTDVTIVEMPPQQQDKLSPKTIAILGAGAVAAGVGIYHIGKFVVKQTKKGIEKVKEFAGAVKEAAEKDKPEAETEVVEVDAEVVETEKK